MGTLTGTHVSHYHILERLRFDPAFAVYNAYDVETQEAVQFWVVFPDQASSESFGWEFLDRLQLLSLCEHPNLIPIKDFGREQGLMFWITPIIKGSPLSVTLGQRRTEPEAAWLSAQIAAALEYLHRQDVLHGCLSPETVYIGEDGVPLLALYGLAGVINPEIQRGAPEGLVGFGLGQPGYLSPEQIENREVTAQADLYALGGITYALLAGQEPFLAATPAETVFKQMTAPLEWPKQLPGRVSQTAIRFVHKCLSRSPEDRFATAAEARPVLERLVQGKGARVRVSRAQMKGAPQPAYLPVLRLCLVAALLLAAGTLAAWQYRGELAKAFPTVAARAQVGSPSVTPTPVKDAAMATILAVSTEQAKAGQEPAGQEPLKQEPQAQKPSGQETSTATPQAAAATPTEQPSPAPTDDAASSEADGGMEPTAAPRAQLPGSGPVLIGTPAPGEAQALAPANIAQVQEIARLGFGKLNQVAWSPDATTLAVASTSGVYVFNMTGLLAFIDPRDEASSVEFSLDGSILAVGLQHGDIQLWDWQARQKTMTLQGHTKRVSRLLFSPNRRHLISASYDLYIKVWEVSSGKIARNIPAHQLPVKDLSITADGRQLVSGSADQMVKIWDIAAGSKIYEFKSPDEVQTVAITQDGQFVAAGGPNGEIYQWGLLTHQLRTNPIPVQRAIWNLYYLSNDQILAGLEGGQTKTISATYAASMSEHNATISTISGELINKFGGSGFEFSSSTALTNGAGTPVTATVNWDGMLQISAIQGVSLPTMFEDFTRLVFSPDSRYLLAGGKLNQVFLWSTADNRLIGQVAGALIPDGYPFSASSSQFLLAGLTAVAPQPSVESSGKGTTIQQAKLYNSQDMSLASTLSELPLNTAAQFINQDTLLIAGNASSAKLWDIKTGLEALVSPANELGCEVSRSANNRQLLSIYSPIGLMREWDDKTSLICNLGSQYGTRPAIFSPDRQWLVSINTYGQLEMLNTTTKKTWAQPIEHPITTMAFSPDGMLLVSGSPDGTLTFWDVAGGKVLKVVSPAHFSAVRVVAFSPDGKRVASGSGDGTVRIWEVNGGMNP